ncbi:tetratricopeptide (TPR) repeat protein [Lipingzhangella halophila]|uniref:Tetratricopeptide (TPR) repeat protein n=1 Tax=Lipingzhangella halophila TaxID=1783352 RepID=A0A7W7RJE0_9ACTN|nr:CHAT domain-containing protein [Lipingzhangella halophila]MBB4933066.1 tetratricopeptide (TPR) repeat protein [Lipingzhangella halophila]
MAVPCAEDVHLPVALIARGPREALRRAERALSGTPDAGTRSTALRIMGLARRELGETEAARALLRRSAAVAERAGLAESAAHARASHQGLRALRGESGVAGASLDRLTATTKSAATLTLVHRGVAAAQRGRFDSAVTSFDSAHELLLPRSDDRVLAGLLSNRGLALLYSGRLSEAATDLRHALALAEEHSLGYLRGVTQQNLGCLAVRNGDIAQAVAQFTTAATLVPASRRAALALDHAEALLAAGMAREAARLLSAAPAAGNTTASAAADEAIAQLLKARIHLRAGQRDAALAQARRVRSGSAPDSLWARLARRVERAAVAMPGDHAPLAPEDHRTTTAALRSGAGIVDSVPDAGSSSTGTATATGSGPAAPTVAGAERVRAHCVTAAPVGPPSLADPEPRYRAALRALAGHDHRGAHRALLSAPSRPGPPATTPHLELQAHAHTQEREVANAGTEIALRAGDTATALHWIEYGRALSPLPERCRDASWTRLLERCRAAHARASAGDDDALDELRRLAPQLGGAQWHRACARPGAPSAPHAPATAELAAALGDRAFVCFARTHREAVGITLVDGVARAHPLGPPADIADAAAKLLLAARSAPFGPAARGSGVAGPAAHLERLLVAPVAAAVGSRPLVIAPAPYAQDLPWGMLEGLSGRAVTVVPSGRAWLDCRRRAAASDQGTRKMLLAAGPGLDGAAAEVRSLRQRYPDSTVLVGPEARVPDVLGELDHCGVAHLSAHGYAPAGTPMLSGLTLADGPLFAYDLERLSRTPALTVLSSCWGGRSQAAPGGFPLGLGTALLAAGGATVVAGVLPVSDHKTAAVMAGFHDALAAGAPPAQAVATHLAGSGFVCFGAG